MLNIVSSNDWSQKWYLITIKDPLYLSGESFYNLTNTMLGVLSLKYVILDRIQGAGKGNDLIYKLQKQRDKIHSIDAFLDMLLKIEQFEWGDFYFFSEFPSKWSNPEKTPYFYVITQSNITVRAVDNQYMYIYTLHSDLIVILEKKYLIESKTEYDYDAKGRLTSVITSDFKTEYQYDETDRRVSKIHYVNENNVWKESDVVHYFYWGSTEIGSCNDLGQIRS